MGSGILTYVQKQLTEYSDLMGYYALSGSTVFGYDGLQVEEGRM